MTLSLNNRLLLAASLVLAAFLGLTGLALDQAFRESTLASGRERLQTRIYMLLGATDIDADGRLTLPDALPESRFSTPGSGLFAQVTAQEDRPIWSSPSMLGVGIAFPEVTEPGEPAFDEVEATDGSRLFGLSFKVIWETEPGSERHYVFQVAESQADFTEQVTGFRHTLWLWLAGAATVLLAVQGLVLAWTLTPLRQAARDVREIEMGKRSELSGPYPRELRPLTGNLNALIRHDRAHLRRYRASLDDLAHSLKTPLAVLRAGVEDSPAEGLAETVREQIERMDRTVAYQLQRAAASGRTTLTNPVPLKPAADSILNSLHKVYRDKKVTSGVQVDSETRFYGDEGDLIEILGNLTDNAFKWCRYRIRLKAYNRKGQETGVKSLVLEVEDDGPGIPVNARATILDRGVRADSFTQGHGIGLAVVRELVEEVYSGRLEIGDSSLGGASVKVSLQA